MAMNQSCYAILGEAPLGPFFTYYMLRMSVDGLRQRSHGSVFDTITKATFATMTATIADDAVMFRFEKMVEPHMQRILCNVTESIRLQETRDKLLPKLLSGEIDQSLLDKVEMVS